MNLTGANESIFSSHLLFNLAALGNRLRKSKITDKSYLLAQRLASLETPPPTPAQIEKLKAVRNRPFCVHDREGHKLFQITIQQIIDEMERLVKRIPGAEIEDVELVGSEAAHIIDSDLAYNISVQLLLLPSEKPLEIQHNPVKPNDTDIRFKLKGCTIEDRKWLSKKLIEFYTRLAKEQSTELLAQKVAKVIQEKERLGMIDQMKNLVLKIMNSKSVPGLDPKGYQEIRNLIKNTPLPEQAGSQEEAARFIAEAYIINREPQIIKAQAQRIARHFKVPCEMNASEGRMVEKISQCVIRSEVFKKLCHVDDEKAGNSFSIHSFADLELLLARKINSHLLTVDANKISLINYKIKGGLQGILDRLMRVVRVDRRLLSAQHFMKFQSYKIQGFNPDSAYTEELLAKVVEWALGDAPRFDKFWTAYIDNHLRGDPLKVACFLFSCCLTIQKHSTAQVMDKLLGHFKGKKDLMDAGGWARVINTIIHARDVPLEDSEILIQALSALYLRKHLTAGPEFNISTREDAASGSLKLALRASSNAYYYLNVARGARDVLEKCCELIEDSIPHQRLFNVLYNYMIGDQEKPKFQLIELLQEIGNSPAAHSLWIKIARSAKEDELVRISEAASSAGIIANASHEDEALWDLASIDAVRVKVVELFASGKEGPAWNFAIAVIKKRGDKARPVAEALAEAALKSNHGVAWNLSQIFELMQFFSKDKEWYRTWLCKCAQKVVAASIEKPDMTPAAFTWMERLMQKEVLENGNVGDLTRIVLQFLTKVNNVAYPYPSQLVQAIHDHAGSLLGRVESGEALFDLLEGMRARNLSQAVSEDSLRCTLKGYGYSMAQKYINPAHRRFLQAALDNLAEYVSSTAGLSQQWETTLQGLFDLLLKRRQFDVIDSFMKFASGFPALSESCKARLMLEMQELLDAKDASAELQEILDLKKYGTNISLEIWARLLKAASQSKDRRLRTEVWDLWETHVNGLQPGPGQAGQDDLIKDAWSHALPLLNEGKQMNRLIVFLGRADRIDSIFQTPESRKHIEQIMRNIRKLNPDKAWELGEAVRKIRALAPIPDDGQQTEEMVRFDLWWAEICMGENVSEGLTILERLKGLKEAEKYKTELVRLFIKALTGTAHKKETSPDILERLERLSSLIPSECTEVINDLWGSPHILHTNIVWSQFFSNIKSPALCKNVSVKVMNEALITLMDDPVTLNIDFIEYVFSRPPFKENEGMKESALKYLHKKWDASPEKREDREYLVEYREYLVKALMFCCPSVRLDTAFQKKLLAHLETLSPQQAVHFYNLAIPYYKLFATASTQGLVNLQNPDLYQGLLNRDENSCLRINIFLSRDENETPGGLKPIGALSHDILQLILRNFGSVEKLNDKALLLDMAYSLMQTAVASRNYTKAEQISLIEKFVYLCPINDAQLFELHIKKIPEFLHFIQKRNQCFNDDLSKLHELLFYCYWDKPTGGVTEKDAYELDEESRWKLVKKVVSRLQQSGAPAHKAHACHVAKGAINGFIRKNPQALIELYGMIVKDWAELAHLYPNTTQFIFEDIFSLIKGTKWKDPAEKKELIKKLFSINQGPLQEMFKQEYDLVHMTMYIVILNIFLRVSKDALVNEPEEYSASVKAWLPLICSKIKSCSTMPSEAWFELLKDIILNLPLKKDSQDTGRQKSLKDTVVRELIEANHDKAKEIARQLVLFFIKENPSKIAK